MQSSELNVRWSERFAPGPLALVQDFLNAPEAEPTADELQAAAEIRAEAESGESQAAIAARYGISQQLVSALLRNRRASTIEPGSPVAAPTLGTASSALRWLESRGFPGGVLSPAAHARLLGLREALFALSFANNGHGSAGDALLNLDELAAGVPLRIAFESSVALRPVAAGPLAFEAAILAAVYDAMRDGTWSRLKACPADRCRYVFYDTSRNRTSTWCSMAICGNRTKVRNYQQRAREARRPDQRPRA